jgi:hypothetical protein
MDQMLDVGKYEVLSDRDHTFIKHITLKWKDKNLNKKEESSTDSAVGPLHREWIFTRFSQRRKTSI